MTAGSTWTYENNPGAPYTLTATNRDTVAAGKTYRVLSSSSGGNTYRGKSGNDYYRFGAFSAVGLSGVEELYLKDNQPVNTTWSTSQNITVPNIPFPLTAVLAYTIKSKGETRTVSGKTYSNVVYVRLDISIGGIGSIGGGDFYYAEGVGLVESKIIITAPGQQPVNQTQVLTSYTIK
jgi:hypothetical protein